jgi:hypothetical protein
LTDGALSSSARVLCAAAITFAFVASAQAATATLDFDALDGGRDGLHAEEVRGFYRGGLGSLGTGPGPNLGITFTGFRGNANPIALCNDRGLCNNPAVGNSLFVLGNHQNNQVDPGVVIHIEGGFRGIIELDLSISNLGDARIEIKTEADNISSIINKGDPQPGPE